MSTSLAASIDEAPGARPSSSTSTYSRTNTASRQAGVRANHNLQTPKSSSSAAAARRRGHKQLSAKQLDKIVKNLTSVQRSVGHLRSESIGSLSHIGEVSHEPQPDDIVLGEDGQREWMIPVGDDDEEGAGMTIALDELAALDLNNQAYQTESWLQKHGVDPSLVRGAGKGPDGIALAKIAARGPKGKENAAPDSFLHETGFVFNPLNRRIPPQTPRKAAAADLARRQRHGTMSSDVDGRGSKARTVNPLLEHQSKISRTEEASNGSSKREEAGRVPSGSVNRPSEVREDVEQSLSLTGAPRQIRESLIVRDVLSVLAGGEGQYIDFAPSYSPEELGNRLKGASFIIDSSLDPPFADLLSRILPLATYASAIDAFIETESSLEFGTVMHAMCAAIRDIIKDFEIFTIQLQQELATSSSFTLHKLWLYLHPILRKFALLYSFITEIIEISHANVLEPDDEEDDDNEDASSGDEAEGMTGEDDEDDDDDDSEGSLAHRRRKLLQMDDESEGEVLGGVVKGGEVLSMLWDRLVKMRGDAIAHELFSHLLLRSSQPYARILLRWINTGHLSDPYEEFLIVENTRLSKASLESDPTDDYWERRYTLRDEAMLEEKENARQQGLDLDELVDDDSARGDLTGGGKIPAFLEPWKRKILLAGKYLNVLRECGKDVPDNDAEDAGEDDNSISPDFQRRLSLASDNDTDITSETFFDRIEAAYQLANSKLLSLLIDEQNVIPRLRSMKHYFFQSHADFFSSFMEAAGRELRKEVVADKVRDVTVMRLQSHLGMVLGSSNCIGFADPYREDVRVRIASENAYDQLKRIAEIKGGIEAARAQARMARQKDKERVPLLELLQFDLAVKFPVSLVISRKNTLRWQFLQRPIIHLKSIERSLCDVWSEHQEHAWCQLERGHPELQRWKMRIFRLRHRILFFVQQVLAFITAEILEPNWRDLEVRMEQATTVDQFLQDHFNFLNRCRKECMLTDLRYVEMLSKLTSVAVIFCENRVRFRDQLHLERASWQQGLLEGVSQLERPKVSEEVSTFLARIEAHWERRLSTFKDIVALLSTTDNPAALPLSYRLQSA